MPTLILSSENPTFLAFTASWCGACQRAKPTLEQLCIESAKPGAGFDFVQLDTAVPENADFFKDFRIAGYPTLLVFQPGQALPGYESSKGIFYTYQGSRNVEEMVLCIRNMDACEKQIYTPSPIVQLKTHAEILAMGLKRCGGEAEKGAEKLNMCSTGLTVLAFTGMSWCGHCKAKKATFDEWHQKTHQQLGFHFRQFDTEDARRVDSEFGIEMYPSFLLFHPETGLFEEASGLNDLQVVRSDRVKWTKHPPINLVSCEAVPPYTTRGEGKSEPRMNANAESMNTIATTEHVLPSYLPDLAEAIRKQQQKLGVTGSSTSNPTSVILLPPVSRSQVSTGSLPNLLNNTPKTASTSSSVPSASPTILFVQPVIDSTGSSDTTTQKKAKLEPMELCGDCVTIFIFTGTGWCDPCKVLVPHVQNLKRGMGHGKYHLIHVDRAEDASADSDAVLLSDALQVKVYPTILMFHPQTQTFYEYRGVRQAHHIQRAQLNASNIWSKTPNNMTIYLKHQNVEIKNLVMRAETDMDLHLCSKCITIVYFSIGPHVSSLQVVDGKEDIHVLHFNAQQHPLVISAFRMNVFPTVLVYVPRDGVFFVFKGDISHHKHIKVAVETRQLREVWKVSPRVVLKTD